MQLEISDREIRGQSQEYRLRLKFERDCEQQTLLHKKALEDLDDEALKLAREVNSVEQATFVIQNEHQALQTKLENIKRESKTVEEQYAINKAVEKHQDSLLNNQKQKLEQEHHRQEELEV